MKEVADAFLKFLGPSLPSWVVIVVVFISLLLIGWPRVKLIVYDLLPSYRAYQRQKMDLELLKLRYEIAAIKKKNKLPDLRAKSAATLAEKFSGSSLQRAFFGALGALVVSVFRFVAFARAGEFASYPFLFGALIAMFALGTIGAILAYWLEARSPRVAFIIGLGCGALITAIAGH